MRTLLLLALLAPAFAWASEPAELPQILEQQRALKASIEAGQLEGLTPRQISAVRKAQMDVFAVTEGKTSIDELTIDEKVRLQNALQRIDAQVAESPAAKDAQDVCWRERATGTAMKVTRCGTVAEMREAREGARGYLERPKTCGVDCGATP